MYLDDGPEAALERAATALREALAEADRVTAQCCAVLDALAAVQGRV